MAPILVVGSVGDFQDAAVFGLAWKLSLLLSFPLVVAEKVLVSEISKIKSENGSVKSAAGFLKRISAKSSAYFGMVLVVIVTSFENFILNLYGQSYADVYMLLLILSVPVGLNCVLASPNIVLLGLGEAYWATKLTLASLIVFATLVLILGFVFEEVSPTFVVATGYAISKVINIVVCFIVFLVRMNKERT